MKFFECNICGFVPKSQIIFEHIVNIRGEGVLCPECNSHERFRAFHWHLSKHLPRDKQLKFLHFAPEKCLRPFFASFDNLDYISVDKRLDTFAIECQRAMQEEDIQSLSFNDNEFDIILCSHVLEHVVDDNASMKELFRVLRPGGYAIIDVPVDYNNETIEDVNASVEERLERFGSKTHLRYYGKDFKHKLESVGFKVSFLDTNGGESHRLSPKIHICDKE